MKMSRAKPPIFCILAALAALLIGHLGPAALAAENPRRSVLRNQLLTGGVRRSLTTHNDKHDYSDESNHVAVDDSTVGEEGGCDSICLADACLCPDGTHVERDSCNNCEFNVCLSTGVPCGREGEGDDDNDGDNDDYGEDYEKYVDDIDYWTTIYSTTDEPANGGGSDDFPGCVDLFCTDDVCICPCGTRVGRDPCNGCAFLPCPRTVLSCGREIEYQVPEGETTVLWTSAATTEVPTTAGVTTEAVTTNAVTTEAVTTEPVTTEAVTTEAVTTAAVTTEAVTTSAVTTEAVTTAAVTTEAVTTESGGFEDNNYNFADEKKNNAGLRKG